jgi:hypothetical protein
VVVTFCRKPIKAVRLELRQAFGQHLAAIGPVPSSFLVRVLGLPDDNRISQRDINEDVLGADLGELLNVKRGRLTSEDDLIRVYFDGQVLDPPSGTLPNLVF